MTLNIRTPEKNLPRMTPSSRPASHLGTTARSHTLVRSIVLAGGALLAANSLVANSVTVQVPISGAQATYALLANPYTHGANTVGEVFSSTTGLPSGTIVHKYVPASGGFVTTYYFNGAWSDPGMVLNPGEGFFLSFVSATARSVASSVPVTFTGDPIPKITLPPGGQYAMVGAPVDKGGALVQDLGYPPSQGDYVFKFDVASQSYIIDDFDGGAWESGSEPKLAACEGFFLVRPRVPNLPSQWLGAPQFSPGQILSTLPIGTTGPDYGQAVAVDRAGNILIGGTLSSHAFVAKRTPGGSLAWSLSFGPGSGSVQALGADSSGNVYVTGNFGPTIDFGGGQLSSAGGFDIFLAKFSPNGSFIWARRFGSSKVITFVTESGYGLAVDQNDGSVTVTGIYDGTVDFGRGTLTALGGQDMFLARFSPGGTCVWSRRVGGTRTAIGTAMALDGSGNIFVTGDFGSTVDFGSGPVTPVGNADMFVAKYSPAGANLWAKSYGASSLSAVTVGNTLGVDGAGDVAVAGNYQAAVNLGGTNLPYSGYNDIFLAKYSGAKGDHLWSMGFGGSRTDSGMALAMDTSGNITLTGLMGTGLNFGEGSLAGIPGNVNVYIASFSGAGSPRWSKNLGVGFGGVQAAVATPAGHWFIAGTFSSTVNFGLGSFTSTAGSSDMFLAEFAP